MKLYRQKEWKRYCAEQIKLHGGRCAHCLRSNLEVVLQVHHRKYVKGRMPWDYPYEECLVLCRGCHAKEHGIIMPSRDWDFIGEDDLGGLDGECEYCGKELRYTHMVTHPNWGTMIVGAQCCDKLTETTIGSESHVDYLNYVSRRKTFVDSRKWKTTKDGEFIIERAGIVIKVAPVIDQKYRLEFDEAIAKTIYDTKIDAQISAFDLIESGKAERYLIERRKRMLARIFYK